MTDKAAIDDSSEAIFVGKNATYYLNEWTRVDRRTHKMSWNWAAFSLGPIWLVYRKMYRQTLFFVAGFALLCWVASFVGLAGFVSESLSYSSSIAFGIFGNLLYKTHAERTIQRIESDAAPRSEIAARLRRKGGTSWLAALLLTAVSIAMVYAFVAVPESYIGWLPV